MTRRVDETDVTVTSNRSGHRRPVALAAVVAVAVLAGCGGGAPEPGGGGQGGGGGQSGTSPAVDRGLQKIARCMKREGATGVKVDAKGANLLPAESSTGAIVATVEGIRVNVYAHRNDDDARDTNGEEKGSIKSFRDGSFASAWQRDPDGDQRDVVRDCLPKKEGSDNDENSSNDDGKQQK